MTFVTCIYSNNPNSIIGGRGRDLSFFLPSLINISKLGFPLVLYTSPHLVERTFESLNGYFTAGLKVIGYDLEKFKHFDKFINWKKENIDFKHHTNDRNEILCYSKVYWLKFASENNFFNDDTFMWIDAGLTHHGIFPEAKGGVELLSKQLSSFYYPDNINNIFTPTLGNNLLKRIKEDKMFFCVTPWQGYNDTFHKFLNKHFNKKIEDIRLNKHLVAGIFGGKIGTINNFFEKYEVFLENIINDGIYCLEEQIYSVMYIMYPELFDYEFFETWWFYSPGERCSYLFTEGDSFYKIFERIKNG